MTEITPYFPGIIAAYSILFVGAASPGPSVAMLIGLATGQGRTPALAATLGIAFGSVTINILTMLGVGLIFSQASWAISILRFIGAAYILYLAYGAFKRAMDPPELQSANSDPHTLFRHFTSGYLLQITNPKAFSFWLAIASIGAVKGAGGETIVLFIIGAFIISFVCHGAWVVVFSVRQIRERYNVGRKWIEVALGSFLSFAAYRMAASDS